MTNLTHCGIAGDWHIDTLWALMALERYVEAGITEIVHVGDFGFWPGATGDSYLEKLEAELARNGQTLYVTLGNHEDYVRVSTYVEHPEHKDYVYSPEQPHILVAIRGARWSWAGVNFVSVGGAASIDFQSRVEGLSWWPQERITLGDVYKAVGDGQADVLITHDVAAGVNVRGSHRTDHDDKWSPEGLAYANQSRDSVRAITDGVKPKIAFHGHYHIYRDQEVTLNDGVNDYTYRNVSLDMNGKANNLAVLDLATLQVTMLSMAGEGDGMVTVPWDSITE